MQKIVIIGNGISGITCARHIRKKRPDLRLQVISSETDHFFSRTALMYIYMGHMRYEHTKPYEDEFWNKNNIELLRNQVTRVDTKTRLLHCADGSLIHYDVLVIACGSKSNKFGWPGQDLLGVQGLYHYQDVESMELHTKKVKNAVIVGGGLIGVEMAEMLHSRNIRVSFLVRESGFWGLILPPEEAAMIGRHLQEHHIDLHLSTELKEIRGDAEGKVRSVVTSRGEELPCQFVGLTVGVSPNIAFLKDSGIETDRGVLVNEYFETNVAGVYAIGDCAQFRKALPGRKAIEQVWYTGRMHGETLARTLSGQRSAYMPGHWFNSAKFFDIEYQTYGWVPAKLEEGEESFYWEHPGGKIAFRAVYDKKDHHLKGVNAFGFRLKHALFDQWLTEQRPVEYVIARLPEANFDPEFFEAHEPAIIQAFNRQMGTQIMVKKRKWIFGLFGL